jgi:hypothetical protein
MTGSWAYIQFVDGPPGGGGHPDQGFPSGGWGGGHPDQGLPGGRPPHAGHLPSRPGRPVDPGFGNPGWGGGRPDQGLPQPPHVWPKPPGGGLPVDPGWGVGGGEHPDQGPVYPIGPEHPDNELPEIPGIEPPPTDPPPGTVWPPLPPEVSPPDGGAKKAIVLAAIEGVGYRYVVIEISPPHPDQGLPGGGGRPPRPDQGLPPQPGHPDQGLPPTAQPKSRLGR